MIIRKPSLCLLLMANLVSVPLLAQAQDLQSADLQSTDLRPVDMRVTQSLHHHLTPTQRATRIRMRIAHLQRREAMLSAKGNTEKLDHVEHRLTKLSGRLQRLQNR